MNYPNLVTRCTALFVGLLTLVLLLPSCKNDTVTVPPTTAPTAGSPSDMPLNTSPAEAAATLDDQDMEGSATTAPESQAGDVPEAQATAESSRLGGTGESISLETSSRIGKVGELRIDESVEALAISPDGRRLIAASPTAIYVLRFGDSSPQTYQLEVQIKDIGQLEFSPDGELLAIREFGSRVYVMRALDFAPVIKMDEISRPTDQPGTYFTSALSDVAFSPDSSLVAVAALGDKSVAIGHVEDGTYTQRLAVPDSPGEVAFSPDGQSVACGMSGGFVTVLNVSDGTPLLSFRAAARTVDGLAYSPDGTMLAVSGADAAVRLMRADDGTFVRKIGNGQATSVLDFSFSADGTILALGTTDGTAQLYRASDGTLLRILPDHCSRQYVCAPVFSPDGRYLVALDKSGAIAIYGVTETTTELQQPEPPATDEEPAATMEVEEVGRRQDGIIRGVTLRISQEAWDSAPRNKEMFCIIHPLDIEVSCDWGWRIGRQSTMQLMVGCEELEAQEITFVLRAVDKPYRVIASATTVSAP